jgi:hypothetical protein
MVVWEFRVTSNMIDHLDPNHELGMFFSSLEDSIQEVCNNFNVDPGIFWDGE